MPELVEHNCPLEGDILIEEGQPCNWCDELDEKEDDTESLTK